MLTCNYDTLGLRRGDRALDLGCGFGRHAFEAARRGAHVVALDQAEGEVDGVLGTFVAMAEAGELGVGLSAPSVAVVQADALALPFAEGTFDRVICSEVLEHVPADEAAMSELARVLAPGGTMALTVPRFGPELINWALSDEYHSVPGGHVRIYRRRILEQRLVRAGLIVTSHHYAHALHSPYWWLKCFVGTTNEEHRLVRLYHRFLVWDIAKRPWLTRYLERVLSPVMGKSLVVYVRKAPA